jgi:DNA-directed RNA polymerase specialized sigma24 family protein
LTEIAQITGSSERTVRRDWCKARALLAVGFEPEP